MPKPTWRWMYDETSISTARIQQHSRTICSFLSQVFAHRVRKYLGAYVLQLHPKVDAIVFTAGIGEQSSVLRERICAKLKHVGIQVDAAKNVPGPTSGVREIHVKGSPIPILVIPTDEEKSIAEITARFINS